ncbi:MAG TPA: hypothetical protein VGC64_11610, partial [Pyrinomonadaceae bacterium]
MKLSELAEVYNQIERARNEPARSKLLVALFRGARGKTLAALAHLTMGDLVDPTLSGQLGIGPGAIRAALAAVSGTDESAIDELVRQTGDMSEVAGRLVHGADKWTVDQLWQRANRLVRRDENRLQFMIDIFAGTTPEGAKYLTRILLNQMRIGVGTGTLTRSLAAAFDVKAAELERHYAMTNDIGLVAESARRGKVALKRVGLALFRPYQFMNAHKMDDPSVIFERLRGKQIIFEVKYDGARVQIHLKRSSPAEMRFYSRRLNDDTAAMPDLVEALARAWKGGDAIIEGEAVAFDPRLKKKQPFQAVLMRLGRVHNILEKAREIPLVLFLFDLLYYEGEDLMDAPQAERRSRLKQLFRPTSRV